MSDKTTNIPSIRAGGMVLTAGVHNDGTMRPYIAPEVATPSEQNGFRIMRAYPVPLSLVEALNPEFGAELREAGAVDKSTTAKKKPLTKAEIAEGAKTAIKLAGMTAKQQETYRKENPEAVALADRFLAE